MLSQAWSPLPQKRKQYEYQSGLGDDRDAPPSPSPSPQLSSNLRKRLFTGGCKRVKTLRFVPTQEPDMTELVRFILEHEEPFKSRGRLASLYADFRSQIETNPEGFYTNLNVWKKALVDAARAGVVPSPGSTHNLLSIAAGPELARALQHKDHGMPTCLPAVFQDAIKKKAFIPARDWSNSKTSIYKQSWVPSAGDVLRWGFSKIFGAEEHDKLPVGLFILVENVEMAAEAILEQMRTTTRTSSADRILSRQAFMKRFSHILDSTAPITPHDLEVLLTHMARDRHALTFNGETVKFRAENEEAPAPVTQEDTAVANLRDSRDGINARLPQLQEKVMLCDLAAREAVQAKQMIRAKTALRQKKLAESALAHQTALGLQLEEAFMKLEQAADQVDIVEAMKAGAEAMTVLHEKVGGVEGVQRVIGSVNDQAATVDEITGIINESATPVDEGEIDEEFEALEKAEEEKREQEAAARTAARLAELAEAEKAQKEQENTEKKVAETSADLSRLSVGPNEEQEEQVPVTA